MTRSSLSCLVLAGCWSGTQPEPVKPVAATEVSVELAAVTLADDCGDQTPAQTSQAPATPAVVAPADSCAGPGCGSFARSCEQTSMQLAFKASAGAKPTSVRIKRVEWLDADGGVLGELQARGAQRWSSDHYVAWNQSIEPDEAVKATYALEAPDYEAIGGRWTAHEKTFQLRVTIELGDRERVVEKQSITPAMLEPPVPT